MPDTYPRQIAARLTVAQIERLEQIARERGIPLSSLVRAALITTYSLPPAEEPVEDVAP